VDDLDDLRVSLEVGAATGAVWAALVDPAKRREWWPYLHLDARVGGDLLEVWRDGAGREQRTRGTVLAVEPGRRLRCSWRDDGWPASTVVEVVLHRESFGTLVVLAHTGWTRLPAASELRAAHRDGWAMHLGNLGAHLERGRPDGR